MTLSVYDFVRIAAFAVIVLILAFQSTKRFLFVDFLLSSLMCSVYLIRPTFFQHQVNVEFDAMHFWMIKAVTGYCLFYVLFYFFFVRKSKDEDSSHGLLACRTLSMITTTTASVALSFMPLISIYFKVQGLGTIAISVNQWRFPKLFNDQVTPMIFLSLGWSCCGAYHLYKSGIHLPKRGRVSPINRYIKIDIVLVLLMGLSDFLFARYTLASLSWKMDSLHIHLTTTCGLLHAMAGVLGVYAIGFRNVTERKGYLCCRLSVMMFEIATFLYAVYVQKLAVTNMDIAVMLTIAAPAVPALVGLVLAADRRSFSSSSSAGYNLRTRSS